MQPQEPPDIPQALLITEIQHAIDDLIRTQEPAFIAFGMRMFIAFAAVLIVWQGLRMMFVPERGLGDQTFRFAQTLLWISFGYAMIAYYESPLPGIGRSFSNVITDQAHHFAHILDARTLETVYGHFDVLRTSFLQPDSWAFLANLIYWILLLLVVAAKVVMLAVVSFSMIATAVCGLLGPIFVPFFILPKMDWLFWSWLKSILQYSFVEVVAYAYLMIFERFLYAFVTTVPAGLTETQYLTYGLQALVVLGTFVVGILLVPSLTSSIFSGRGGESVLPNRLR